MFDKEQVAIGLEPVRAMAETEQSEKPTSVTDDDQTATAKEFPGGLRLIFGFVAMMLCLLLSGLDGNIIATAVPSITDHFHTVADVGWYYTAYRLTACSIQFPFGKLYQTYSTKWLFIASQAIFLVGSLLCATAVTSYMLVIGRAVTGIGIAGGSAGFFNLMMDVVPPQKRPMLGGLFGAVETLSGIIGPFLGGVLTQKLSWRWCFWIDLPIGGAALLAMTLLLPNTTMGSDDKKQTWRETLKQLDPVGFALLESSLAALLIALNWGGITYPWHNERIIALFVVFGVVFAVLMVQQFIKGESGILPLHVLSKRDVWAGFCFSICLTSSLNILEYYAPSYFQAARGFSPLRSGYMMFPCLLGTLAGFLVQGVGTSRLGYYTPFMIASSILMPVATGLLTTWDQSTDLALLIVYFALAGLAAGIGFQCPQNAVQTGLSKEDVPLGLALVLFAQSLGPTVSISIAQAVFTNRLSGNLRQNLPSANATKIEGLGLTDISSEFTGNDLVRVRLALNESITQTWYLALGLACLLIVGRLSHTVTVR